MATVHREPNQVKWVGVRPGHNGDQFIYSGVMAAIVPTAIAQVPADKIMFLCSASLGAYGGVVAGMRLAIYTDVPAFWHYLMSGVSAAAGGNFSSCASYDPPIEIPAGYWLYVEQNVNAQLHYFFHGWIADA